MPTERETMAATVVDHAARWAMNILVEVTANHGEYIKPEAREKLREAVKALAGVRQ